MRILVADSTGIYRDAVLAAALRAAKPGDTVIVTAAVNVPAYLPVDVPAGEVWKQVVCAERLFHWARAFADDHAPNGVRVEYTRIQGRSFAHAALAAATNLDADLIVIGKPRGLRGTLSTWFGTLRGVLDGARCAVRVIAPDATPMPDAPPARPRGLDPFESFAVVAVNPAVAQRSTASRSGGHIAS